MQGSDLGWFMCVEELEVGSCSLSDNSPQGSGVPSAVGGDSSPSVQAC